MKATTAFNLIVTFVMLMNVDAISQFSASPLTTELALVRPSTPPEVIHADCGKKVTKPYYGMFRKVYKADEDLSGTTCSVHIHAPPNHRVHLVSLRFEFSEPRAFISESYSLSVGDSIFYLYDRLGGRQKESQISMHPRTKLQGGLRYTLSKDQDMVVNIEYNENEGYEVQTIEFVYEFVRINTFPNLLRKV